MIILSQISELKKVLDGHVSHNPEMTLYPGSHDVQVLRSVQLAQLAGQSEIFLFTQLQFRSFTLTDH